MVTDHENVEFIGFRKFESELEHDDNEGVYGFKNKDRIFYLTRDGLQARLTRLIHQGEPHEETSKALKLHHK